MVRGSDARSRGRHPRALPLKATTGPAFGPASSAIVSEIRRSGPIDFETFMSLSLYEAPHGYYQTHMPGRDSDYETSPTISGWFGRLICRRLESMWVDLGRPEMFSVIEVGGGDASLAASATEAAQGNFRNALEWCFVEPFHLIRDAQQHRMRGAATKVRWASSLEEVRSEHGVILANEVLDNFPVRVFEVADPLDEIHIEEEGGKLRALPLGVSDEVTISACEVPLAVLEKGDRFEINFHMQQWCHRAAAAIASGVLLVIDYGDLEPHIYTRRPTGTMVTYRDQILGTDPLSDPGSRDITTHVNFSALERAARGAGFEPADPVTQRDYLNGLGLTDVIQELRSGESENPKTAVASIAERSRLALLTVHGGLGDLLVLEASKKP